MQYRSTRSDYTCTASQAILRGIAPDGGLLVPETFPRFSLADIDALRPLPYIERGLRILRPFLSDFTDAEILDCLAPYANGAFDTDSPAPLVPISPNLYALELYHGPTSAFKDMALTVLPRLMTASARKNGDDAEILVLVATSGDTGKAALTGFENVPNTRVAVFYPENGVSQIQKLQMVTQTGKNTHVIAVRGNFDDAQTGVKRLFTSPDFQRAMAAQNRALSSANSINWGRLAPQIVYYFSAYADLLNRGDVHLGDPVRFAVPTGNFGNILAGIYAQKCGLPVTRFLCASNANRVLTDLVETGVYTAKRDFHVTLSPSMDILISSNLERLLFELCDRDPATLAGWMRELGASGRYAVGESVHARLKETLEAYSVDDAQTLTTIGETWRENGYLLDPHTAVGMRAVQRCPAQAPTVLVSTASPYKFAEAVRKALGLPAGRDEFETAAAIEAATGHPMPRKLRELRDLPVRHTRVCEVEGMRAALEAEIAG